MIDQHHHITMKVLHVSTAISWRGGEQQLAYLILELKHKHVEQYVLCSQGSAMEKWCVDNNVPFFTSRKRSSFDLFFAKRICKICRDRDIQLIHTHDSHAHSFAVYAASFFGNKTKIVVSRRVDFPVSNNLLSQYKYNHPLVVKILCVSDKIRQITAEAVKDKSRLVTVHSGVDVSRFEGKQSTGILHQQYNLPADCRLVVNVSALAPHKDLTTFVAVAERLLSKNKKYQFLLIGEGDERKVVEDLIQSKGIGGHVILTGFRNDIPEVLPEAGLMLMTSETEGLGTTILDAFAAHVPVVATDAGGIPELVINGQTGLLAPVRDVEGLAGCVEKIFDDPELRESLVKSAAKHLEHFSKSATATATLTQYVSVLGVDL